MFKSKVSFFFSWTSVLCCHLRSSSRTASKSGVQLVYIHCSQRFSQRQHPYTTKEKKTTKIYEIQRMWPQYALLHINYELLLNIQWFSFKMFNNSLRSLLSYSITEISVIVLTRFPFNINPFELHFLYKSCDMNKYAPRSTLKGSTYSRLCTDINILLWFHYLSGADLHFSLLFEFWDSDESLRQEQSHETHPDTEAADQLSCKKERPLISLLVWQPICTDLIKSITVNIASTSPTEEKSRPD